MQTSPTLRPYQQAGVEELLAKLTANKAHGALLADDCGLGKSCQSIEVMNRLYENGLLESPEPKALIVCPASLCINWKRELAMWLRAPIDVEVRSYGEIVGGKQESPRYKIAVFDESHYLKNPDAKRTKACMKLQADFRIFSTGTPILSRPMELYPILQALGIKMSRVQYGVKFCAGRLVRVPIRGGHGYRKAWDFQGASNLDELNASLRSAVMVRRSKAEVLTELPPKVRQIIAMDFASGESEAFRKHFASLDEAADILKEAATIPFQEIAVERHNIALAKLPHVIKFIDDLLEEEEKLVVFAHHRDVVKAIVDAGPDRVMLLGGMSKAQKDAAVQEFQHGKAHVFVGQMEAAGVGLTLTAAQTVVFAELDWTPGNVLQAEDRLHRIGQRDTVRVFHIVAENSIEARIVQKIVEKEAVIEEVVR
jgi:SWI/SNF-related matrix-associated actin-dependent regulator 1 of chromatin subfamily A